QLRRPQPGQLALGVPQPGHDAGDALGQLLRARLELLRQLADEDALAGQEPERVDADERLHAPHPRADRRLAQQLHQAELPGAPRSARCTRWVAVWDREVARRRSTSISAWAGEPTTTSPDRTVPRCTTRPGSGVWTSVTAISAGPDGPSPRMMPWSGSWPPP